MRDVKKSILDNRVVVILFLILLVIAIALLTDWLANKVFDLGVNIFCSKIPLIEKLF